LPGIGPETGFSTSACSPCSVVGERVLSRRYRFNACLIAAMSCLAATMRASSGRPMIFGTTSAARMPRIATTTMISIRVKPCRASDGADGQV